MILRSVLNIKNTRALVLGISALALLLRLLAVPPALGTMDEVHFASALTRYDLLQQSPHAPGYPVYVILCRLFAAFGVNPVWALSLPGILLSALSVGWFTAVVSRRWNVRAGAVTGVILAASPLAVVVGGAPASDSMGFALCVGVVAGVLSDTRRGAVTAGALFGLLLGARLSHAPLAGAALLWLVWQRREWMRSVAVASSAATLVWLVPFSVIVGWSTLRELVPGFAQGHLTQWGKGLASTHSGDASLWLRWGGLGFVAPGVVLLSSPRRSEVLPLVVAMTLGYGIWMVLGQNPEHARHAVPLVIPFALMLGVISTGASIPRVWAGASAVVTSALFVAIPVRTHLPAAVQLSDYLAANERPESLQLFGGSEVSVIQHEAPMFRAARPMSTEQLRQSIALLQRRDVRVLATNTVLTTGQVIARFDEPSFFAWPRSLQLLIPQREAVGHSLTLAP